MTSTIITYQQRARGALLGLAVGDAIGTTVEFKPRGSFKPLTDMAGGGPFGLEPGQFTDDTSMALCLAASLIDNGFDLQDQMERYTRWANEGYMSSNGRCFDIGIATVLECQEMFRYDSQDCRAQHEPQIVAELKLKTTHPDSGPMTPCSRCAAPVDRNLPHVSYIYLEGILTGGDITVTDDAELAVLCRDCEEPDEPATHAAAAVIDQPERSRA